LNNQIETTPELVYAVYKKLQNNISEFRKIVKRSLTLGHLAELDKNEPQPDRAYVFLQPERVALQDVTGGITAIPAVLRMQLHFRNKY
jgi:hypothetical protein